MVVVLMKGKKIIKPELLSPAGDWASLRAAVHHGADSVYFGIKTMNMRHMANNFDLLEMKKVMDYLRENKRRGYLALNTVLMEEELGKMEKILREAHKTGVDAVILWDMAALALAKELKLPIHLSTQASVSNSQALTMYSRLGVKRIILARECSLKQIKNIKKIIHREKIDCQIESFIHGAMCVSLSGRCFLSSYAQGASANKGQCIQPCRREYYIKDIEDEMDFIIGKDYVLSPKDLCTVEFIDELIKAEIDCFKIEGRIRSPDYIGTVTSVYREAIDRYCDGTLTGPGKKKLLERLKNVYNRGFSHGFFYGIPSQDISRGLEHLYKKEFLGEVTRYFKKIKVSEIKLQTKGLRKGDQIIFIGKRTPANRMTVDEMQMNDQFIDSARKGEIVGLKLPFDVRPKDKVFQWVKNS